jgi:hypothetical protein
MSELSTPPTRRWPRAQRFTLSAEGSEAEEKYRSIIVASRQDEGRASYDAARMAWASEYRLQPDDALYLGEARSGPVTLAGMVESLDTCGKTHRDALAAVGRLLDCGFVTAIPVAVR